MKQISVGLGPELIEKLKKEARNKQNSAHKKTRIPVGRVVRQIITEYFKKKGEL